MRKADQLLLAAGATILGLLCVLAVLVVLFLKRLSAKPASPVRQQAAVEAPAAPAAAGRSATDRMRARLRRRRNAAAAADDDASSSRTAAQAYVGGDSEEEGEEEEEEELGEDSRREAKRRAREEARAAREATQQAKDSKRNLYNEKRAKKDAEREAAEAAQQAEIEAAAAAAAAAEEAEAAKWLGMISVEQAGTGESDVQEESQGLLAAFVDYIKERKTVVLDELAAEFGLRTQDVINRIQGLEAMGRLTGVMDDRGKFIYISVEEMEAVAAFIKRRGRIAISELAAKSSTMIDLDSHAVEAPTGALPELDFLEFDEPGPSLVKATA